MNESLSKVSIVLPTYNGSEHLRQSIDSCLNQTYKNIELIIVDDCSTDRTPEIVKSYKDERIKYLRHRRNKGLPYALNTGFAKSTGEYLTWTSDDNQYLPKAIEEMILFLAKHEDADLVYADYWAHYLETDDKELRRMPDNLNLAKENGVGPCFLYTRRAYEDVGDYDPRYQLVEDYDYWIRICKRFKAMHYCQPLYVYGEHPKSLKSTRQRSIKLFEIILKYQNKYISLPELRESFCESFYEKNFTSLPEAKESLSNTASTRKSLSYLQSISKISRLSFRLCLLSLLLLMHLSVSNILEFYTRIIFGNPWENINFFFSFKSKYSHLKVTKDRKNILCIAQYMVLGGAEKVLLDIAKQIGGAEFTFHLVTTLPANNVWYDRFRIYFQNIIILNKKTKSANHKYLKKLIEKLEINIVLISNSIVGYEHLPQLKSEFGNVRFIDVLHAEDWPPIGLVEWSAPFIDRRVCISHHLKNYLVKRYKKSGINEKYVKRLKVIYNGIDAAEYHADSKTKGRFKSRFSIPDNVKIISYIGRFSYEKNPLLYVEIARKVVSRFPNELKFVMAGDGPEIDNVKDLVKEYRLQNHFLLTGVIDEVAELLNDTYVLLVVSRAEGIPLVVLEAMNMGVPVVSTDVGAISEVIENDINGYLIGLESGVVESFACKILDLLTAKANYREMSEEAREAIVPRFTLESMGSEYQNIFKELTENS